MKGIPTWALVLGGGLVLWYLSSRDSTASADTGASTRSKSGGTPFDPNSPEYWAAVNAANDAAAQIAADQAAYARSSSTIIQDRMKQNATTAQTQKQEAFKQAEVDKWNVKSETRQRTLNALQDAMNKSR